MNLFFRQVFSAQLWLSDLDDLITFVTRETTCSAVKLEVLLGGGGGACFRMEA